MTKTQLFSTVCFVYLLTGCSLLQFRGDLTLEQKVDLIHDAAASGTSTAILNIYDNEEDHVKHATELRYIIKRTVLVLLDDPNATLDVTTEKLVFAKVPKEYAIYIQNALVLFRLYYETPKVGELLDTESLLMLRSLFQGVVDGCEMVLDVYVDKQVILYIGVDPPSSVSQTLDV